MAENTFFPSCYSAAGVGNPLRSRLLGVGFLEVLGYVGLFKMLGFVGFLKFWVFGSRFCHKLLLSLQKNDILRKIKS